ncbi:DUF3187 family protein [bacterium]|nr:MAG: DUF3187 family protein [bacterium]
MTRLVGAFALLLPVLAGAQTGPLEIRNGRFLNLPFLRPAPRGSVLLRGQKEWGIQFSLINDVRTAYGSDSVLRVSEDAEVAMLNLRYRQGLGNGLDATLEIPLLSRGGGVLDGFLDGYHRLLGLQGGARRGLAYGRSEIDVNDRRFGSATGIGDTTAALSWQATPRLVTRASVKLPTGDANRLFGSGRTDVAADAIYRLPMGPRMDLWGQLGAVHQGGSKALPGAIDWSHVASLTLEIRANTRDTYFGLWQSEDAALGTGAAMSDETHRVVSLGYRRRMSNSSSLEAWFMEDGDFLNYKAKWFSNLGPDVVFGLGLRYRF